MGSTYSTYGTGEVNTRFWWGSMSEDHLEDPGIDRRIILKSTFEKWDVVSMNWVGTGGGLL
jgi:hypothetical protein